MKFRTSTFQLLFIPIFLFLSANLQAQDYNEDDEDLDTIIEFEGHKFQMKPIEHSLYDSLYNIHYPQQLISKPIYDVEKIEKLLAPDIFIDFKPYDWGEGNSGHIFTFVEKKNKWRLYASREGGCFEGYYPKERILAYGYGMEADGAVYVDTGEEAPYIPKLATLGADSIHFMQGEFDLVETTYYTYYKLDSKTNKYVKQFSLSEALGVPAHYHFSYLQKTFWIKNTFYFATGFIFEEEEEWLIKEDEESRAYFRTLPRYSYAVTILE